MADDSLAATRARHASTPFWKRPILVANIVFVIGVVVVALHFGKAERFLALFRQVDPWFILVAVFFQLLTYICVAGLLGAVLRNFSKRISIRSITGLSVAKLFIDQVIPTLGVGGSFMVAQGFVRRGATRGEAMAAIVTEVVSRWVVYFALFAVALALLWEAEDVTRAVRYLAAAFSVLFVLILLAVAALVWAAKRRVLPKWVKKLRFLEPVISSLRELPLAILRSRRIWAWSLFFQGAIFILDAGTLWACLRGLGVSVSPGAAFVSFMMASAIATMSLIPGGVGFFEGVAVGVLASLGVSFEAGIAATVLLRGLTTWLPMIPGVLFFRYEFAGLDQESK